MTDRLKALIAEIRERHARCCDGTKITHDDHVFESCDHWEPPWCNFCSDPWPCDAARLVEVVEKQDNVIEGLVGALEANLDDWNAPGRESRTRKALARAEEALR